MFFFFEHVDIIVNINYVKNIDLLSLQKKKNLSFHYSIFIGKVSVVEPFFERGSNSLKRTHVEGGVHIKRTGTNKRGRGSKIGSFERTYFQNDPLTKS